MERNAKHNCETIISGKEQNLKKQMAEFGIFRFFKYLLYILTNFNTFSRSQKPVFTIKYFSKFQYRAETPFVDDICNRHSCIVRSKNFDLFFKTIRSRLTPVSVSWWRMRQFHSRFVSSGSRSSELSMLQTGSWFWPEPRFIKALDRTDVDFKRRIFDEALAAPLGGARLQFWPGGSFIATL